VEVAALEAVAAWVPVRASFPVRPSLEEIVSSVPTADFDSTSSVRRLHLRTP